jgi:hypothetical protein
MPASKKQNKKAASLRRPPPLTSFSLLLNWLINRLPFELHLPGYQFCGPGTRLRRRLVKGQRGINRLDQACLQHDLAYARHPLPDSLEQRHAADRQLRVTALQLACDTSVGWLERLAARFVALLMRLKLSISN